MKLLRLAVENQDWKLAAHVVVFKAAEVLTEGAKADAKSQEAQGSTQGQPKRS